MLRQSRPTLRNMPRIIPRPIGFEAKGTHGLAQRGIRRSLVGEKIPEPTLCDTRATLLAAIHEANRLGLTGVERARGD